MESKMSSIRKSTTKKPGVKRDDIGEKQDAACQAPQAVGPVRPTLHEASTTAKERNRQAARRLRQRRRATQLKSIYKKKNRRAAGLAPELRLSQDRTKCGAKADYRKNDARKAEGKKADSRTSAARRAEGKKLNFA